MTKIFDIIRKALRAPRYYYSKHALKKERRLLKSGQWTVVERNPKDIFFLQVRDNLFCRLSTFSKSTPFDPTIR